MSLPLISPLFYTDDVMLGLQDSEWLRVTMNLFIGLFRRYGLVYNISKSKAMTRQKGTIRSGTLKEAVGRRRTGRRAM